MCRYEEEKAFGVKACRLDNQRCEKECHLSIKERAHYGLLSGDDKTHQSFSQAKTMVYGNDGTDTKEVRN